jgi:F0F1-type ATP synthase beta subunit
MVPVGPGTLGRIMNVTGKFSLVDARRHMEFRLVSVSAKIIYIPFPTSMSTTDASLEA